MDIKTIYDFIKNNVEENTFYENRKELNNDYYTVYKELLEEIKEDNEELDQDEELDQEIDKMIEYIKKEEDKAVEELDKDLREAVDGLDTAIAENTFFEYEFQTMWDSSYNQAHGWVLRRDDDGDVELFLRGYGNSSYDAYIDLPREGIIQNHIIEDIAPFYGIVEYEEIVNDAQTEDDYEEYYKTPFIFILTFIS